MSSAAARRRSPRLARRAATIALSLLCSCTVGPNFSRPAGPTAPSWLESHQPRTSPDAAASAKWWQTFGDETLDRLIETAYTENLSLRAAGLRVLQAQARRGIAIGE